MNFKKVQILGVRIVTVLIMSAVFLTGCIGQYSQSFITSVADVLSLPYMNINLTASYKMSEESALQYGGLFPEQFILSAEGNAAENLSKYDITIYIKQPDTQRQSLLRIYGSGLDMYLQAHSYPFLLPELLFYKEYINEFEYEHLKTVLEDGSTLKIDAGEILSKIMDDNHAVNFLTGLLDDYPQLNYSNLYSSLAKLACDSVDELSDGLTASSYGTNWVKYKTTCTALYGAWIDALELIAYYSSEVAVSLDSFLQINRLSFSERFMQEREHAVSAGGVLPEFKVYEDIRFTTLLEDAVYAAKGLDALSLSLLDKLADKKAIEDEKGIKTKIDIALSGVSDKLFLRTITEKKLNGKAYLSSDIKLSVASGTDFALPVNKSLPLRDILWAAARDYYKSEENHAVFLYLDYNSMTATVTTAAQNVHEYAIEGITQEYFNDTAQEGTAKLEDTAIIPLRLVCEIFGEDVGWDPSSGKVYIVKKTGEDEQTLYLSGKFCSGKLFTSVKEMHKLGIVCFGDNIYGFELAR